MIIPILCQSCGKPIGHLWFRYVELVKQYRSEISNNNVLKLDEETPEFKALRSLGLERDCCRISFMCTVDLSEQIS